MTREQEIKEIAIAFAIDEVKDTCNPASKRGLLYAGFVSGAEWADQHPHWISVEEELPPNKELVFITDGEFADMGFYDYTDDAWQPCEKWLDDITHWMPLPQPPKEGGEE